MNLDSNGLPVQSNGDANDQLQRLGMIAVGQVISGVRIWNMLPVDPMIAIETQFQPRPGLFVRYPGANPNNCSADQLISALAAYISHGLTATPKCMFGRMLKRVGFAQNTHDGLDATQTGWKLPDFMLLRAMPLFMRMHWALYPLAVLSDLYLVVMAVSAVIYARQSPDNVDQNNTILTLAVCSYVRPTPVSFVARKIFAKLLPYNYGCDTGIHPVAGSLVWYHRAASGGNPEIADLWKPICRNLFE